MSNRWKAGCAASLLILRATLARGDSNRSRLAQNAEPFEREDTLTLIRLPHLSPVLLQHQECGVAKILPRLLDCPPLRVRARNLLNVGNYPSVTTGDEDGRELHHHPVILPAQQRYDRLRCPANELQP